MLKQFLNGIPDRSIVTIQDILYGREVEYRKESRFKGVGFGLYRAKVNFLINDKSDKEFYDGDVAIKVAQIQLADMPANHIIKGTIVGFTPDGAPLVPDVSKQGTKHSCNYGLDSSTCRLYVNQVSYLNGDTAITYSRTAMEAFCSQLGLDIVPAVYTVFKVPDVTYTIGADNQQTDMAGMVEYLFNSRQKMLYKDSPLRGLRIMYNNNLDINNTYEYYGQV